MFRRMRALPGDTRAATAIEYGLIVSLIVIAIIGSLTVLAGKTIGLWGNISAAVTNAG